MSAATTGWGAARAADGGRRWSLRRRVGVLAVVLSGLVALTWLAAALAFGSLHRTLRSQATLIQPARSAVVVLERTLLTEDLAVRDYLIRPRPAALAAYRAGPATVRAESAALDRLLAGEPGLRSAVRTTVSLAASWRSAVAVRAVALAATGHPAAQVDRQLAGAHPQFAAVLATFPRLDTALSSTDARATAAVQSTTSAVELVLFLACLVTIAAALTTIALHRRWVTRPVTALHDDLSRVAGGDLAHRIGRRGPPELARVADDAEAMRRRILAELASLQSAEEEIRRQAEELRRSNRDLEEFAYAASHDLQEPLRKVASFCELLERRDGDALDERGRQYAALAADGARRMQALIRGVLALARIGRAEVDLVPVDLSRSLDQALANLSVAVETSGAEIDRAGLPVVQADPALMVALFQNLVANALAFRPAGVAPRIEIRAWSDEGRLELSCTDNGVGIDPAQGERVFDMFHRLDRADGHAGTGIGLALCRRIVECHGGRIWVDTSHHGGARIRWCLPSELAVAAVGRADDNEVPT